MTGKDGQRRPKAADITDAELVAAVEAQQQRYGVCVAWWNVAAALGRPEKVTLAKMRSAVRRGVLLAECTCGCKGPYKTPDFGAGVTRYHLFLEHPWLHKGWVWEQDAILAELRRGGSVELRVHAAYRLPAWRGVETGQRQGKDGK